mmetsp:Transcript_17006/g.18938  ORF Transcript_17006/g.18938 Transcript_17006/m.18938 type:complete len:501 (+) Transcript_17006:17-1519(+)
MALRTLSRVHRAVRPVTARVTSTTRSYTTEVKDQDCVIIGGGPGGYVAAIKAAQLGLKVTCIEKRGDLGGTCLNVGCIPSKRLLQTSHMYEQTQHYLPELGIECGDVKLDLDKVMKGKDKNVKGLTGGIEFLFKKNGVNYVKGHGKFKDKNTVVVDGLDGKQVTVSGKNFIIATGSDSIALPGLKIDEEQVITSTGALSLKKIPKHMVLVGGGVIGLEMGSVWKRFGAEVTCVELMDDIAAGADKEIAKTFKQSLTKQGMKFMMQTKVLSANKQADGNYKLEVENKKGEKSTLDCDVVLVAIGRRPYTDNLGLENTGVKLDQRGRVEVDHGFATNVSGIYAIGDVIKGPMLAHKAEEEGIAAVENIINPGVGHVNYDAIPSVVYTHPEVAWVGKTEEELKEAGIEYNKGKFPFSANSRAKTNADAEGFVKFLADKKTDKVLGAHMIGPNAGELIAEAVMTIEYGGSSEDIGRTCHAHPTLSEAVKEAAMATSGKPIHIPG